MRQAAVIWRTWRGLRRLRRDRRRLMRFHARCDYYDIPAEVRERILRGNGPSVVDWYAGRRGP